MIGGPKALPSTADVVIVGAGFAGMYLIHLLRAAGFSVVAIEKADGVGGTWYWNRYPGARCDIESVQYAHGYLDELQQDWNWSERYASQPELLRYANEIADRLDLRRDICFEREVRQASYDEQLYCWNVTCNTGETVRAPFFIMATGCLSVPNDVAFDGIDDFSGPVYHTGRWPHEEIDFSGQRVAVIGTGSSGIQAIPVIAEQAAEVTVFQRTPNYAVPAHNHPLDSEYLEEVKATYPKLRALQKQAFSAAYYEIDPEAKGAEMSPQERDALLEQRWAEGGLGLAGTFPDQMYDKDVNEHVAKFVRAKIHDIVDDPYVADLLSPTNIIGAKRLCVTNGYFETFNEDHVSIVDVSSDKLSVKDGFVVVADKEFPADSIVCATGFDAMTGAVLKVEIRGRSDQTIQEHWRNGPKTYLGLAVSGFPNMFTVTGPHSPSVFTNVTQAIEQHCEWIAQCIVTVRQSRQLEIEATSQAESDWVAHNAEVGARHLRSQSASWYTGENIDGKPIGFMPYIGGFPAYADICANVAKDGYRGFNRQ